MPNEADYSGNRGAPWSPLGTVAPGELTDARLELHWAAQLVSAVGKTFVAPRADDSHPNLEYIAARGFLRGNATATQPVFRAALTIENLGIRLEDERGERIAALSLVGVTMNEAFGWLEEAIEAYGHGRFDADLDRSLYEIPAHNVGRGAPFGSASSGAFRELRLWYHNADRVLRSFAAGIDEASPVRCWPHHFDIGALVVLDSGGDPESARAVGMGMTPGDAYYPEPYWYVNPHPRPMIHPLPDLPGKARWHQNDWFGAVLRGSELTEVPADRQEQTARDFVWSAFDAAVAMLKS